MPARATVEAQIGRGAEVLVAVLVNEGVLRHRQVRLRRDAQVVAVGDAATAAGELARPDQVGAAGRSRPDDLLGATQPSAVGRPEKRRPVGAVKVQYQIGRRPDVEPGDRVLVSGDGAEP